MKKIILFCFLFIFLISFTSAVTLYNATTNSETYSSGATVTFTGYWGDAEMVRLLIANNSDFTSCNYSSQSGCIASSSEIMDSPIETTMIANKSTKWYAQVCDNSNCSSRLKTYNFSIGSGLNNSNVSFLGESANDYSGYSVSSAGDVNGDGYDDILIGAYNNADGSSFSGKTYVIFGKSLDWNIDTNLNQSDASFLGEDSDDYSGYSVSSAGDVNGDGYDDILIGAYNDEEGGSQAGQTYLILGKESGWEINVSLSQSDASFIGEDSSDYSGYSVSSAGDVNGDGYDDILIGAYKDEVGGSDAGQTYLIFGKATGWSMNKNLSTANASFIGEDSSDYSGYSVSSAGDVNGDGYDDILIGAYSDEEGGNYAGQTYLIFGKATGWSMDVDLNQSNASFLGESANDYSGYSVSSAGDVNGDGYDDILIGAYVRENYKGQTYLIFGKATGWSMDVDLSQSNASFLGNDDSDNSGYSVSSAGDVNGDGYDDILIGAYMDADGGNEAGGAYIVFGCNNNSGIYNNSCWLIQDMSLGSANASFLGEDDADNAGTSVSSAGDVNGDGYDDILIGAPKDEDGGMDSGQTYLIISVHNETGRNTGVFSVDSSPPILTITSPTNTIYDTSSVTFSLDSNENLSSCKYTLNDWVTNYTMSLDTPPIEASSTNNSMSEGIHNVKFWCDDLNGNINDGEEVNFTVDFTAPNVTLNSPNNNSIDFTNVTFNCSATDSGGLVNISLYSNYLGSWQLIETKNISGNSNETIFNRDILEELNLNDSGFLNDGFSWNCLAYDVASNNSFALENNSFSNWNLGSYNYTYYNSSTSYIMLNNSLNGSYISRVFDLSYYVSWNNISWIELDKELPNNAVDTSDEFNGFNMSENVLLMHFNNDSDYGENDTYFYDFSGSGNNGTCTECPALNSSGKLESAYTFDGINDKIGINDSTSFDFGTGPVSFSFWMKLNQAYTDSSQYMMPILTSYESNDDNFYISLSGTESGVSTRYGELVFKLENKPTTTAYAETSQNFWSANVWYHVAVTRNAETANVYINGQEDTGLENFASGDTFNNLDADFEIGGGDNDQASGAARYFNGIIDELAIWNRSLSASEVISLYQERNTRLNIQTRTSEDNLTWNDWSSNHTNPSGLIDLDVKYLQYKILFNTENISYSSYLQNVNLSYSMVPIITSLHYPNNNNSIDFSNITFNCSAVAQTGTLSNISLYSDYLGSLQLIETKNISGTSNETIFNKNMLEKLNLTNSGFINSKFKWNCLTYNNLGNSSFGSENYTFSNWDLGTYNYIHYNSTIGYLSLNSSTNGTYISQVFSSNSYLSWNNLSWEDNKNEINYSNGNILLMHFDEDSANQAPGGTDAEDSSEENNHGTESGGVTFYISGMINNGFKFDGSDDYIDCGNSNSFKLTNGEMTLSAWINITSTNQQMFIFHGQGCSTWASYMLSIGGNENEPAPGKYGFGFGTAIGATNNNVYSTQNASTNQWVHLVGTYNGSLLSLYVNGVLNNATSGSGVPWDNGENLSIGADPGCGIRDIVSGLMDEITIWNRSLSASEVTSLYQERNMKLNLQTRTSNDNSTWSGWSNNHTNPSGLINESAKYLQYKAIFSTGNIDYSLFLQSVNLSYLFSTDCNPSLNLDWIISTGIACNSKNFSIGTGQLIVNSNGILIINESSNITVNGLRLNRIGDSIYVGKGSKLKIT
jgi:concanavalin A-like lectin/glucanase superfamily protein/FG-GAP repeat protein